MANSADERPSRITDEGHCSYFGPVSQRYPIELPAEGPAFSFHFSERG
jgi:hypothetical protein